MTTEMVITVAIELARDPSLDLRSDRPCDCLTTKSGHSSWYGFLSLNSFSRLWASSPFICA
jgi:hypothetical protein